MVKIIRYDTWGNAKDGFEVNDQYSIGTIANDEYDPIETLLEYFGKDAVLCTCADYGDDREEVVCIHNDKPLGALVWDGE